MLSCLRTYFVLTLDHVHGDAGYIRVLLNCYAFSQCLTNKTLFSFLYFLRWDTILWTFFGIEPFRHYNLWDAGHNLADFVLSALYVMLLMAGVPANSIKV